MLTQRLITGPILIAALLLIVWLDDRLDAVILHGFWRDLFRGREHPPRGLLLLGAAIVIALLAAREIAAIVKANGIMSRAWLTALAAVAGLLLSYCIPQTTSATTTVAVLSTGLVLMFVTSLLIFSRDHNVQGVLAAAGAVIFAMVYLGLMLGFLIALRRWHSAWLIVGVILTTKACDIGAYFTGRAIGRHKLIVWLSPGKTWEGLLGGVALATLVGVGFAALSRLLPSTNDHVPLWLGAVCGCLFALVGQFGDLTMSLLKRGAGLKDSSTLVPGMGGVMDVLDSPLMVAPLAFWLLELNLP